MSHPFTRPILDRESARVVPQAMGEILIISIN